jgi:3-oxoacyl-[acyl-carrier protein] reductase
MERFRGIEERSVAKYKVALVTGASRGIGKGIALRLAADGVVVALNYRNDEEGALATLREIEQAGGRGILVQGDVASGEDAAAMVAASVSQLGGIHILVNNAGVSADALAVRMTEADWDRVVDTDLKGAFLTTKAALRTMIKQRWGRIINVASVSAFTGNAGQANYAAAKAGLLGLTKSVAREVATRGITANVVAPGFVRTDMTAAMTEEGRAWWLGLIPMERPGTVEDVAAAVSFLASDEASYITGQVLRVDGGMVMT